MHHCAPCFVSLHFLRVYIGRERVSVQRELIDFLHSNQWKNNTDWLRHNLYSNFREYDFVYPYIFLSSAVIKPVLTKRTGKMLNLALTQKGRVGSISINAGLLMLAGILLTIAGDSLIP